MSSSLFSFFFFFNDPAPPEIYPFPLPAPLPFCVLNSFRPPLSPPIEAGSIAELAGKFDLDPATLEKTIVDFNAAVRPGTFDHTILDDCHTEGLTPPKSHWARRIEAPPYYAYPVRPGIHVNYLGTRLHRH